MMRFLERIQLVGIRWIYLILGILIMLCLGTVYSWSVFRLSVENHYGISSFESGIPYFTSLFFYALSMLVSGKYLEKFKPSVLMVIGGLIVSLGWILSSLAPNVYILSITYGIVMGTGVGVVYGVILSLVAKWFTEKVGFAVGFTLIGFGLSPVLTAPIANYLVESNGVLNAFLILGISFAIILTSLSLPMKYPSRSLSLEVTDDKNNTINIKTIKMIKSKNFIGLYLSFLFGTIIGLTIISISGSVGIALISLSANQVALAISIFALFNGIGRPLFGWITDKFSYKNAMIISYVLMIIAATMMLTARAGDTIKYFIAFSILWLNLGGWLSIAPASTFKLFGSKNYSQNYGVVFTAYGIGAIIGVSISGLLLDIFNNHYLVYYFIIIICICGLFSSQLLIKKQSFSI